LRSVRWAPEERRDLTALAPLTLKPAVVVANAGESGPEGDLPEGAIAVAGALEAEVAGLDPADAAELLGSYGLAERGIDRVIRAVYATLDLVTFLTAGEKESHAWEVPRGATAPQAAGAIHSDFERGFIRAEVVAYEDLVAAGSWNQAKSKGLIRQEGKTYVVREGDVVEFRFAV
jgi:ribosome-binding ATPase YchF (GTP1/OBG family)